MKKSLKKKYAQLLVRSGIALKKGQSVLIRAGVDQQEFVAIVMDECYRAGAKHVQVEWIAEACTRVKFKRGKLSALKEVLPMETAMQEWLTKDLPCLLVLHSDDPDAAKGLDAAKMAAVRVAHYQANAPYVEARSNKYQWCIAGVPSKAWAKKIFPDLPVGKAVEALWEAILSTSRAADGNGIENWVEHNKVVKSKCEVLNSLRLKSLHYTSSNGTDLTVGLIPGVLFEGGAEHTLSGISFQPNIPSEECFTSPMKGEAEGIVYSSKPLVYQGHLIRDFWVRFENGKAVDVHAEEGEEALRSILTLDEGSAYLGECALVPYDSPINNTGLLFYSTLFDENAACHLALGRGFTNLYPEFEKYTDEEIHGFGINKSLSHVDFMIGSKDLCITGITEKGESVEIFRDGNWAI
ncbi:MAG: aminopeptidase [Candidatus Enteromonas sp.]|nr:aminopeptidase [Candidatus Enteromonas sp.]